MRAILLLSTATLLMLLSACASPRVIQKEDSTPPLQLDDKVLIESSDEVTIASDFIKTGDEAQRGMAEGAVGGAAAGLEAGLGSGLIFFPPVALALVGGGAVFGAIIGGVGGSITGNMKAADAADLQCLSDKLPGNAEAAQLNSQLARELQLSLVEVAFREIPIQKELVDPVDALYPKLLSLQIDGTTFGSAKRTTIEMQSTMWRRKADGSVMSFDKTSQFLRPRPLKQWCELSDEELRLELQQGVKILAGRISNRLLLANDLDVLSDSTKCPSYIGLALASPPPEFNPLGGLTFTSVDSLNPVLSWDAFPRQIDLENNPEIGSTVKDVIYDLEVSQVEKKTNRTKLAYSRQGLKETSHKIEEALSPGQEYIWAVRPRFNLLGSERSLSWSKVTYDTDACGIFASPAYDYTYRFETPKSDHQGQIAVCRFWCLHYIQN